LLLHREHANAVAFLLFDKGLLLLALLLYELLHLALYRLLQLLLLLLLTWTHLEWIVLELIGLWRLLRHRRRTDLHGRGHHQLLNLLWRHRQLLRRLHDWMLGPHDQMLRVLLQMQHMLREFCAFWGVATVRGDACS
jgi:hypothetical protein